jgi:hypothetical protein
MKKLLQCICMGALLLLPGVALSQSETLPLPDRTWELGIRVDHLQYYASSRNDAVLFLEQTNGNLQVQGFALRYLPGSKFVRGSAGLSYGRSESLRMDPGDDDLSTTYHLGENTQLHTEAGVGYEFSRSSLPILDRMRFRLGLNLAYAQTLHSHQLSITSQTDSLGAMVTHVREVEGGQYSTLRPAAFFQFELRIAWQLYLGLEWKAGPTYSNQGSIITGIQDQFLGDVRNHSWSWNHHIAYPSFSIGYSF